MNPLRLRIQNVGRFQDVDLQIPEGCVALTGPNGSGKSTILNAIEFCLFADGSRDLAPLLSPWADRLEIQLDFEHAGERYRVRRGYRQTGSGGKATLDLEQLTDGDWQPLTREDAKATQAFLVELLGLSRDTFNASSFLGQGNSAAFPEASPADRKALLGAILDPRGLWPRLAEKARAEAREAERGIEADLVRVQTAQAEADRAPQLEEQRADAGGEQHAAQRQADDAEAVLQTALAAVQANETAAARHKAARDALEAAAATMKRTDEDLTRAVEAAEKLPAARAELAQLDSAAARIPRIEAKVEKQREEQAEHEKAVRIKTEAEQAAVRLATEAERVTAEGTRLGTEQMARASRIAQLREAQDGEERCDHCRQLLGAEARQAASETLTAEISTAETAIELKATEARHADQAAREALQAAQALEVPEMPTQVDYAPELAAARDAATRRGRVATLIAGYEEQELALDMLQENIEQASRRVEQATVELQTAREGMQDTAVLEQAVADARGTLTTRRSVLDAANAAVIRLDEQLARARKAAGDIEEIRTRTAAAQARLDLLRLAERAYGRDGIPVLLVESVIPQIEADTNRLLELAPTTDGVTLRVALETQRALKTDAGKLRETLDILVSDADGVRPYETFSGGERSRINYCLRIALAALLAGRRGAESRLLALDEVEYLDALGQEQLVEVVRSVADRFDRVLVVSHHPDVRDAFDQVVEIVKQDGVSRIAGARQAVTA